MMKTCLILVLLWLEAVEMPTGSTWGSEALPNIHVHFSSIEDLLAIWCFAIDATLAKHHFTVDARVTSSTARCLACALIACPHLWSACAQQARPTAVWVAALCFIAACVPGAAGVAPSEGPDTADGSRSRPLAASSMPACSASSVLTATSAPTPAVFEVRTTRHSPKKAEKEGVSTDQIDEAMEADSPKKALIAILTPLAEKDAQMAAVVAEKDVGAKKFVAQSAELGEARQHRPGAKQVEWAAAWFGAALRGAVPQLPVVNCDPIYGFPGDSGDDDDGDGAAGGSSRTRKARGTTAANSTKPTSKSKKAGKRSKGWEEE